MKPEEQHSVHRYFGDEVEILDKLFKSKYLCLEKKVNRRDHLHENNNLKCIYAYEQSQ